MPQLKKDFEGNNIWRCKFCNFEQYAFMLVEKHEQENHRERKEMNPAQKAWTKRGKAYLEKKNAQVSTVAAATFLGDVK